MILSSLFLAGLLFGQPTAMSVPDPVIISTSYGTGIRRMRVVKPCIRCMRALRRKDRLQKNSTQSSSRSGSFASPASSLSSSGTSSRSSSASVISGTIRSHILVLGAVSPTLAAVKIFSNLEPVDINGVTITFTSPVPSVGSLVIYDGSGAQIGTAHAVGSSFTGFHGSIAFGKLLLPYRQDRRLSVKARLKSKDTGGISGEDVQVQTITVEGSGRWTSEDYTKTSSETFEPSETALAAITEIVNSGPAEDALVSGPEQALADFTVSAVTPEPLHPVRITDLAFTIEQTGGVTLSNVVVRNESNSTSTSCSVSSSTLTCPDIDTGIGTVDDTRRFRVFGDVSISDNTRPFLRLTLNNPGTPTTAGAVTWTDGVTTFLWVDLGHPIVRGTMWR